ncbi:predicted protein [Postia placenta Mad-698-R]|nr:predicted protein [Postia placenta Mad-698-R]
MDSSMPLLPPLGIIILTREGLTSLLPSILSVLVCLIATVIALSFLLPYFNDPYKLRAYPGPFLAKFTSTWASWVISHNQWLETVDLLHHQYSPIVCLGPDSVSIADPVAFAVIHQKNMKNACWHFIRVLEDTARVHFQILVHQWDTMCAHAQKAGRGSAKGAIGDLTFGHPFGMLEMGKDTAQIVKSNARGMKAIAQATSNLEKTKLDLVDIPAIEVLAACLAVTAVANKFASKTDHADMHSKLLEGRDVNGNPYDPEELSAEVWLLIIAGGDMTVNTSCATTYYLMCNLQIQAKLQAELNTALDGINSDVASYNAVKDLLYLGTIINEGLCLHATVGVGLPSVVPPGGLTVLGHHLKEGTVRSEAVWGKNACEFYPERWLEASVDTKKEMM